MSFALVFAGVVLGFVMAAVLFIQKIWDLRDRLLNERYKSKFYKKEYEKAKKHVVEWRTVYNESRVPKSTK